MNDPRPPEQIVYRIDPEDRLVDLNEGWRHAAASGDAPGVAPEVVLGRELWDSITDAATLTLYQAMVMRARTGQPITFLYRCDTPTLRRLYRMDIKGEPGGQVSFTSTLAQQDERPSVALLEANRVRSAALVRMCSWCQQVALPDGTWVAIEHAVSRLRLMETGPLPGITHGICAACADRIKRATLGNAE